MISISISILIGSFLHFSASAVSDPVLAIMYSGVAVDKQSFPSSNRISFSLFPSLPLQLLYTIKMLPSPSAIHVAHSLIHPYIHHTPLLTSHTLNTIASTPQTPESLVGTPFEGQPPAQPRLSFFFKCENYQRIGAFKARGAFHALLRLIEERGEEEVKRRGVITHSSGIPFPHCPVFTKHSGKKVGSNQSRKSRPSPRPRRLDAKHPRLHRNADYQHAIQNLRDAIARCRGYFQRVDQCRARSCRGRDSSENERDSRAAV